MTKETPSNLLLVLFELLLAVVVNSGRFISILFMAVYRSIWPLREPGATLGDKQTRSVTSEASTQD